jgi:hypothetical protein
MNPMDVLAPNIMADQFSNKGVEGLTANRGWGVVETAQANPGAAAETVKDANPAVTNLRRGKAKQMGRTMEEVGF